MMFRIMNKFVDVDNGGILTPNIRISRGHRRNNYKFVLEPRPSDMVFFWNIPESMADMTSVPASKEAVKLLINLRA